ncbi:RNA-binding protein 34 [Chanos chanos]|uniref:RNA-binding protein 34 n=1 Tax=Chanos chanos TaxID=29144 RepID=A0A6J2V7S1_CHACN|nr:RNA-binding protein 34 [Chanos chanos]
MKRQAEKREDKDATGECEDYVIGQLSGSLFPKKQSTEATSLSSLFSTEASKNTLVFVPAPKPQKKTTDTVNKPVQGRLNEEVKEQKRTKKEKSAAELKVQDRESALQNADEEDFTRNPKKTKRKATETEDEDTMTMQQQTKRRKTAADMAEERIKMKRTVFVGNLPASCSKKALKMIFKEHGTIESIRFRSVVREDPSMSRKLAAIQRKVHPKKQNINAYIVFKEAEGAANALKKNGHEIERDFHIRVDRVSQNQTHDHKRSIFVGNLPYDITELPFRQHFEECGTVEAVRLVRDKDSGMGKGFGYILFESPDAVMLALKMNGSTLLDRKIRVKRSVKKEKVKHDKGHGKGPGGKAAQGKDAKSSRREKGLKRGGCKGQPKRGPPGKPFWKNPSKAQRSSSFKGEMADATAKRGKGLKKKFKQKKHKTVHH